jgi:hypothetical protein
MSGAEAKGDQFPGLTLVIMEIRKGTTARTTTRMIVV